MEYVLVFFIGSCFGSFFNVISYRSLRNMDYIFGRSICPNCKRKLSFFDMIPILSYLLLNGKCRYCKNKINKIYLFAEIAGGLNALACYSLFNLKEKVLYFILFNLLLFISLRDIDTKEVDLSYQIVILINIILIDIFNNEFYLKEAIIVFAIFYLIMITTKAMGGADTILYSSITLFVGKNIIFVCLFSLIIGCMVALYYIIVKKKNTRYKIAFIPCIYLGLLIYFLFEQQLYILLYIL